MEWLTELDYELVLGVIVAVATLGYAIAKLTKTDADDNFFSKIIEFLGKLKK